MKQYSDQGPSSLVFITNEPEASSFNIHLFINMIIENCLSFCKLVDY